MQCCRCGGFFPDSAVLALVLGISFFGEGILALALIFLGYTSGVAFLAPAAYPTLSLWLLALWVFAASLLSGGP